MRNTVGANLIILSVPHISIKKAAHLSNVLSFAILAILIFFSLLHVSIKKQANFSLANLSNVFKFSNVSNKNEN